MKQIELVIIGGGSAGMAAALSAFEQGVKDLMILEKDDELGGILQQCIHNGFGLQTFHEELSGPAYAQRYIDQIQEQKIPYETQATVLSITLDKQVTYVSPKNGYQEIQAKAIILAGGCYERSAGGIQLPGTRPKGIYTAGTAQRYLNIDNVMVGRKVFILGSGDIGLIMARRMTLEGAEVVGVAELMPYSNGLMRNIVQCLKDYEIPLYLSHTVVRVEGFPNLERVVIAEVDANRQSIEGTEKVFEVDTLLLSVGLLPENSLAKQLGLTIDPKSKGIVVNEKLESEIPGIFACGNGLHVHDLVDFVSREGTLAGKHAAAYIHGMEESSTFINCIAKAGVGYILPQRIHPERVQEPLTFSLRVTKPYKQVKLRILKDGQVWKELPKRYLLPAEMVSIVMKPEDVKDIQQELQVEVCES